MSRIKELLNDKNSILVFDVDGVLTVMEFGDRNHYYACDDEWYSRDEEINYCPKCGHSLALELDEYGNYYHIDFNNESKYKSIEINDYVFVRGRGVILIGNKVNIKDLKVGMTMYFNGQELHLNGFEYESFRMADIIPVGLVFGAQINQNDVKIGDKLYYRRTEET